MYAIQFHMYAGFQIVGLDGPTGDTGLFFVLGCVTVKAFGKGRMLPLLLYMIAYPLTYVFERCGITKYELPTKEDNNG